ncbi:helix-turn-helix transcriptional regulator [Leucobacter sp. CSA2]|uniref:Helix-turn-helix transcriptional regulator n=1 Tax=Leucobacter edaphi TaxID=2796472 RepID=A0A934QBT6_9MICO|nr:helix-turn-helix transcriptional regulator [Leucobacter edaphi]
MPKIHSDAAAEIGRRIRARRHRLALSLEDLGDLSGVSWTTVGKIERGAQSPSAETIVRLAHALELDAGELLTGISIEDYGREERRFTARDFISAQTVRAARIVEARRAR